METTNDNENTEAHHDDVKKEQESTAKSDVTDIYSKVDKFDITNEQDDPSVVLASAIRSVIEEYINNVNSIKAKDVDNLSDDSKVTVGINNSSLASTLPHDCKYSDTNAHEQSNDVTYAGKHLGISKVGIKATGKLTGSNAVAKLTSVLGIGKHVNVTLWHSGFSVLLAPPKESDIVSLHYSIAKQEHKLGMETNNLVYSNYGVVINRILTEFIMDHIVSATLELPEDADYIDYIKAPDLDTLALGMATAMRPDGYPITLTCVNSINIVDNAPACSFTAKVKVIPENLLWVNRSRLTSEQLEHISKTTNGAHSVDSVMEYQSSLPVNQPVERTIRNNEAGITMTLNTPTLREYIDNGEYWINEVISMSTELFTKDESPEAKEAKIDAFVTTTLLNVYNSYITKIDMGDSYVSDSSAIYGLLEAMSSSPELVTEVIDTVTNYIGSNNISVAATYNFNCPECADNGRDPNQLRNEIKGFKELLPFNPVDHFFDLSTLKFTQIMNSPR